MPLTSLIYNLEQLQELEGILVKLKDPIRMKICLLLKQTGLPMPVKDVAKVLQIEETLCSWHLRKLEQIDLLRCRREGRMVLYYYNHEVAKAIVAGFCDMLLPNETILS